MEPISIVLAEDHLLMRVGTRRILEQYPDLEVVGEAEDGQQALELIARLKPDVAILDIRMPKLNGNCRRSSDKGALSRYEGTDVDCLR